MLQNKFMLKCKQNLTLFIETNELEIYSKFCCCFHCELSMNKSVNIVKNFLINSVQHL